MTDTPAMMLWTDAYMSDTSHLTTTEHGAYLLILMAMWRAGGSLPSEEKRLARTARLPMNVWRKIAPTILDFMTVEGESITQKRLRSELKIAVEKREIYAASGSAGGQAKSLKRKDRGSGGASVPLVAKSQRRCSNPEPDKKKDTLTGIPKSEAEAELDFGRFWSAYPKRDGSNPRFPAFQKFELAVRDGFEPAAIIAGAEAYAAFMANDDPRFVKQAVAWLNQRCWQDDYSRPPARANGQANTHTRNRERRNPAFEAGEEVLAEMRGYR